MKNLVFLLALACLPARAEWTLLTESVDKDKYYVDSATKKSGERPRVWVLADYEYPKTPGVLSRKVFYEADCAEGTMRVLSIVEHGLSMGRGIAETVNERTEWSYPPPGSVSARIFIYLCGKNP